MRARRTLRPVVAASLLAGLVIPTSVHMIAPDMARAADEGSSRVLAAPVQVPAPPVAAIPAAKPIRLVRHAETAHYRVKQGDCLWRIAARELGNGARWTAIYQANQDQIHHPDLIFPDQVLHLPNGQKVAMRWPTARVARHHALVRHALQRPHPAPSFQSSHLDEPEFTLPSSSHTGGFDLSQALKQHAASATTPANAPDAPETLTSDPLAESFQGHRRINGQFYRMKDGKLLWADDSTAVRGTWSQRLSEQIYPNRQAPLARPHSETLQLVLSTSNDAPNPVPSPSESIQGHTRVNGTFFTLRAGHLVWADTGEAVHQDRSERDSAVVSP